MSHDVLDSDEVPDPPIAYKDGQPGWDRNRPTNADQARYTKPEPADGSKPFAPYDFAAYANAILEAAGLDKKTIHWLESLDLPKKQPDYKSVKPPLEAADPFNVLVSRWRVKTHDLFEIPSLSTPGRVHRVFCGNSMDWDESRYACGHGWPPLMITEPPYPYFWQSGEPPDFTEAFKNFYGLSAYIFTPPCSIQHVANQVDQTYLKLMNILAIRSPKKTSNIRKYQDDWVAACFCVRDGGQPRKIGTNFLHEIEPGVDLPAESLKIQPWVSAAVYTKLIAQHGLKGGIVFDPFAGTGTALLAAEATGNVAYLIDNDPQAVAVILERASLLGMKPKKAHKRIIRAPAALPYITRSKRRIAVPVGPPILADGKTPRRSSREVRIRGPEDGRTD